ncbi:MAG: UDP-N-acetylglucosamine 2-epimerase (non-hydrolyzing) [Planctomycetes bacterium]|nr:UDP-N-acetylglucosamine 2-epimerase (non-hydrolyzing) [Planctomycetota bacterium]
MKNKKTNSTSASLKVAIIVGTRPEAIKMAPVYLALRDNPRVQVKLIATAQHREMLDQALGVFGITSDIDLNIMQPNQSLQQVSSKVILGVQKSLSELKPDAVLVHGDTTTCLCSALSAFYERIPIGHVEAGLRTYNFAAPWPEEMNRRLVDPICRWCWTPTDRGADNLLSERIPEENIFITGNTVIDALFIARDIVHRCKPEISELPVEVLDGRRLILVTGHRRESFGEPFEEFCLALRQLAEEHRDTVFVYPVHLNPNVQKPVRKILSKKDTIYLIPPIGYLPFVYLMDRSYFIITDSGGIQEEAPSLHKPVLVTRTMTERPEAVEAGLAKLVGTSREKILGEASRLLSDPEAYAKMSQGHNPYGDGNASKRIVNILMSTLQTE